MEGEQLTDNREGRSERNKGTDNSNWSLSEVTDRLYCSHSALHQLQSFVPPRHGGRGPMLKSNRIIIQ